jgi:hypothetical protein
VFNLGRFSVYSGFGLDSVRLRQVFCLDRFRRCSVEACFRFTQGSVSAGFRFIRFGLGRFSVYSGFCLDRFHCIMKSLKKESDCDYERTFEDAFFIYALTIRAYLN